jgi:hypothetical protein
MENHGKFSILKIASRIKKFPPSPNPSSNFLPNRIEFTFL